MEVMPSDVGKETTPHAELKLGVVWCPLLIPAAPQGKERGSNPSKHPWESPAELLRRNA